MIAGCHGNSQDAQVAKESDGPARCPHMKDKAAESAPTEAAAPKDAEAKPTDEQLPAYSLITAAKSGDLDGVKRMLAEGVDISTMAYGDTTALHAAAEAGELAMVEYLVDNGATVNIKNKEGRTPLWLAANNDHGRTAKYLISKGAQK